MTQDIFSRLSAVVQLYACVRNSDPEDAVNGCPCAVCNRNVAGMMCGEGHALCSSCMEESLVRAFPRIDAFQFTCLIDGCPSQPFPDSDRCGHMNVGIYNQYIMKREEDRIRVKHATNLLKSRCPQDGLPKLLLG